MNNLKKPVNILFLISLAALALAFFVFNFLLYQKEKEKAKAQTQKAREARNTEPKNPTNNENIEPTFAVN